MDLIKDWSKIRKHFSKSFRSSFHVSIASLDSDNNPTVTPIGSLFLNKDQTGFYFEKFPSKLPKYAKISKKICVLAVNSNRLFWFKALYRMRFKTNPAIKLYGLLGDKRKASEKEIRRLNRRMKATKRLKGHTYLWGDMEMIREIKFIKVETINIGKMTANC
jgi:hypothetical protein